MRNFVRAGGKTVFRIALSILLLFGLMLPLGINVEAFFFPGNTWGSGSSSTLVTFDVTCKDTPGRSLATATVTMATGLYAAEQIIAAKPSILKIPGMNLSTQNPPSFNIVSATRSVTIYYESTGSGSPYTPIPTVSPTTAPSPTGGRTDADNGSDGGSDEQTDGGSDVQAGGAQLL